jgi:hypothetical protein
MQELLDVLPVTNLGRGFQLEHRFGVHRHDAGSTRDSSSLNTMKPGRW